MKTEIELGDFVKDKLSEFDGRVIGICKYLFRPCEVLVLKSERVPREGRLIELWFSVERLDKVTPSPSTNLE